MLLSLSRRLAVLHASGFLYLAQALHLRRYLQNIIGQLTLALLSWDQKLTSPAFLLRRAVLCQAWPHILALFAPLLWQHELLLLEGLHNLQLPANTKAISNTRLFLVSMHYNSHPGADATKPNAHVHPCRKGEGEAVRTAESPRRFAQPTCQLPHAPARQQSICQAAQPSLRLNVAPFPAAGSLRVRRLQGETAAASTPGSYRTLVLSTSQSLNTTFQTEVPEILPYCGPINSAEVQTQLYSKRFTPKIHSSPHNRQNQTLIAMHQLTLPLNPAEPQSSPH